MGTRSFISVKVGDHDYRTIYCHYDGYPDHNGRILFEYYNALESAKAVVELGDLSYLDKSCECPPGHSFNTPVDGYTIAYGRDRRSNDVAPESYTSERAVYNAGRGCNAEFIYIYKDGNWYVCKTAGPFMPAMRLLSEVL